MGSLGSYMTLIISGVVVIALILVGLYFVFGRRGKSDDYDHRYQKRDRMDDYPAQKTPPPGASSFAERPVSPGDFTELVNHLTDLTAKVKRLEARLKQLESRQGQAAPPAATTSLVEWSIYDRVQGRMALPKDHDAPPGPASHAQAPASASAAIGAAELVDRYNDTIKQSDLQELAELVGAEYYTNERSGDISTLLRSDVDRFWLVPAPHQPDSAWLLPGFALRKSWQKFRQPASDHPLAHHFELLSGDKFVVNRAAVVRKDSNGNWQLVEKGEVSGTS